MQRIACITQRPALRSSFSAGTRHNSTDAPLTPNDTAKRAVRLPMVRLGDIVIPGRDEILAKAAKSKRSAAADISRSPKSLLSVRLARLGSGDVIKDRTPLKEEDRLPEKAHQRRRTPDEVVTMAAKKRAALMNHAVKQNLAEEARRRVLTPEEVAAITAKRREERVARKAEEAQNHLRQYVPIQETSELLRTKLENTNVFMSPEKSTRLRASLSRHSSQSSGPRGQRLQGPRRNERPGAQPESARSAKPPQSMRTRSRPSPAVPSTRRQTLTPSVYDHEIDESVFEPGGHLPKFAGPETLSSNLLHQFGPTFSPKDVTVVSQSGTAFKIPISKVDSFRRGDYSRYVSSSKEDYASPSDELGIVKVAQLTLDHQRHYHLTARERTLELVGQVSKSSKPITSHR